MTIVSAMRVNLYLILGGIWMCVCATIWPAD